MGLPGKNWWHFCLHKRLSAYTLKMFQFTELVWKGLYPEKANLWDCISLNSFESTIVMQLMLLPNMGAIRINKGRIPIIKKNLWLRKKQIYMNCIIAKPTVYSFAYRQWSRHFCSFLLNFVVDLSRKIIVRQCVWLYFLHVFIHSHTQSIIDIQRRQQLTTIPKYFITFFFKLVMVPQQ